MTDVQRVERLWLALALATWWMLSVGGEAEAEIQAEIPPETMDEPPKTECCKRPPRLIGVFRLGSNRIIAALLDHQDKLPIGIGIAEEWPFLPPDTTKTQTESTIKGNLQM